MQSLFSMIHVIFFLSWALAIGKYISYLPQNRRFLKGHDCAVTLDDISDFVVNNYYMLYKVCELIKLY